MAMAMAMGRVYSAVQYGARRRPEKSGISKVHARRIAADEPSGEEDAASDGAGSLE